MTTVAKTTEERISRPLHVLIPLIKADLAHGDEVAEKAGMPYYRAAGEKLLEAKPQLRGGFTEWMKRHFKQHPTQLRRYMALAENESALSFSSLTDFIQQTSYPNYNRPSVVTQQVKQIIDRVDTETLNLKHEELKRSEEREAQRKLALQLIDIGYKVLAKTLHPDKGGSRVAMARLNAVRDRLKQCI